MNVRRKKYLSMTTRDGWAKLANELGLRLGFKLGAERVARVLVARIAHSGWVRIYYAGHPNLITERDLLVDVDAVLDALRLVPAARYALDEDEQSLMMIARHMGATWEQIGVALGAKQEGARQTARGKYARLGGNVAAAVPGKTITPAASLVEAPPAPAAAPPSPWGDNWPAIGEQSRPVPAAVFEAPTLLDVDQGGA